MQSFGGKEGVSIAAVFNGHGPHGHLISSHLASILPCGILDPRILERIASACHEHEKERERQRERERKAGPAGRISHAASTGMKGGLKVPRSVSSQATSHSSSAHIGKISAVPRTASLTTSHAGAPGASIFGSVERQTAPPMDFIKAPSPAASQAPLQASAVAAPHADAAENNRMRHGSSSSNSPSPSHSQPLIPGFCAGPDGQSVRPPPFSDVLAWRRRMRALFREVDAGIGDHPRFTAMTSGCTAAVALIHVSGFHQGP